MFRKNNLKEVPEIKEGETTHMEKLPTFPTPSRNNSSSTLDQLRDRELDLDLHEENEKVKTPKSKTNKNSLDDFRDQPLPPPNKR